MPNLSSVDLNLLLVLHTVLEEGSATKAARRLHVTQSAVSNSLAKLRELLHDPLLVRSGAEFVPTPRATQLAPLLATAMSQLRAAVEPDPTFDPATTQRRFTICCADDQQVLLLPPLVALFAERMPSATLRAVTLDVEAAATGLASGELDVLIGMPPSIPPGCLAEDLFEDVYVAVVRSEHPFRGRKMSAEQLARWPHIRVAPLGEERVFLDDALRRRDLRAPEALLVPHFTVAALAALRADYVLPFPRLLALALTRELPLRALELSDLELPRVTTSLVWHARTDADPATAYARELVRDAARALASGKRKHA